MQSKFFWNQWPSPYKQIYATLLFLLISSIIWMTYNYILGPESLLGYNIQAQTETIEVVIDQIKIGPFTLELTGPNNIFFQKYLGAIAQINASAYYIYFIVTALCIVLLITAITTLNRFWYFVGASLLVIILVNLKLEVLLLFGNEQNLGLIIALVLYLPLTYYFNSFKKEVSFITRFFVFFGITIVFAAVIFLFSEIYDPLFHLATHSIVNQFIISLIFILIVAHEIVAIFIYLLTRSGRGTGKSNNITHFIIISLIYFGNLTLTYLFETNIIEWDIIYINLYLLLVISTLLGIWGFKERENQYSNILSFYPAGAFGFLAMAIICFTTLGHFMATMNDPIIEVFRDFIIYAHLGYGFIFFLYIFSNFLSPLQQNLAVYKVLYKPTSMPYFTFRLAGLIAFTAFLLKSNWEVPVNQGMSGYYNGLGDLHYHHNELLLAHRYYQEGAIFGLNNHKSNYHLANIEQLRNNFGSAINYYEKAIQKWPTPQSFINLSHIYQEDDRFFDALFTLQNGYEIFEQNGHILNNLGLLYTKTRILDSAAVFLDKALNDDHSKTTAGSNLLAMLAKNDIPLDPDSVLDQYNIKQNRLSINNILVLKNKIKAPAKFNYLPQDSSLSLLEASVYSNNIFNHLFRTDSFQTSEINQYAERDDNIEHREVLKYLAAINQYHNKDVNSAFRSLNWLANTTPINSGKYFNHVGLWALEQEAPYVAVNYFQWAEDRDFPKSKLNGAIALLENGQFTESIEKWREIAENSSKEMQVFARNVLSVLLKSKEELLENTDSEKYLFLRYRTDHSDSLIFEEIFQTITDNNYKAQALFDMVKRLWKRDYPDAAINYYSKLSDIQFTDEVLFEEIQWFELKMLAAQRNIRGLARKINEGVKFDNDHVLEKFYFTALIDEVSGDTLNARENYEKVAYKNPFYEESVIAAANFINRSDRFEAYNILINAIDVNPESIKILKAYIMQCARVERDTYANISLEKLQELIPEMEFKNFVSEYNRLRQEVAESWDY